MAGLIALGVGVDVSAQVSGRPPRSADDRSVRTNNGIFGGQRRTAPTQTPHQFSLTFDLLSGWESNLSPDRDSAPVSPGAAQRSGTTTVGTMILEFERTSPTSGLEASLRTVGSAYQGIGLDPALGARAGVRAFRRLFKRLSLNGWSEIDHQPTFMIDGGGVAPEPTDLNAPADLTGGVTEVRTTNVSAGGSAALDFGRRHSTALTYTRSRTRSTTFTEIAQVTQTVSVSHRWNFVRNLGLSSSYRRSRQISEGEAGTGSESDLDSQAVAVGLEIRVPVSRTRRLTFTVDGGATQVQTTNSMDGARIDYVTPSGSATARLDLGRTWAATGQVHRVVTSLEGLTRQSFVTTSGTGWIGGNLGRRSMVSINGSFSSGAPHQGDVGSFRSSGGAVQLQYTVSRCCAAVTSYSYYEHRVRDVALIPVGFPVTIDRSAVRLGFSVWLPLHGTFSVDRRR